MRQHSFMVVFRTLPFRPRLALASLAVLPLAGGCGDGGGAPAAGPSGASGPRTYPIRVTATVGMVADIVRQVGGDRTDVRGIIGEGVDPHLYKPTRNDVGALLDADLVFYSGLRLEGKMGDALEKVKARGKPVHAVTESIGPSYLLRPPEWEGNPDPHVWMDVKGWMKAVEEVARVLGELDPPNRPTYEANARAFLARLEKLDGYAREVIGSIPERGRVLITAHDAFNYFGRAYGIEVKGIQGISTESEAGIEDINRLVRLIVERDVRAVFVESSVPRKNVQALIEGARSHGKDVKVGGSLFSDAMGATGTYEGTYIGMIDHNATTIARALGGKAPPRGMEGKLREDAE
jgi:manganese/zinc/iron transport system substrate-binding protein